MKTEKKSQSRGLKTRERILVVAMDCLLKYHVHGLRYSQIAKDAGVAQPLMDYHFPSLEALLLEMIQIELAKLRDLSTEAIEKNARSPRKALAAYISAPFELAERDPYFRAVWSAFYHLASTNPEFGEMNRNIQAIGRQRITQLIRAVLAQGLGKRGKLSETKLQELAAGVQGIITGYAFLKHSVANGAPKDLGHDLRQLAVKHSEQLLGIGTT